MERRLQLRYVYGEVVPIDISSYLVLLDPFSKRTKLYRAGDDENLDELIEDYFD